MIVNKLKALLGDYLLGIILILAGLLGFKIFVYIVLGFIDYPEYFIPFALFIGMLVISIKGIEDKIYTPIGNFLILAIVGAVVAIGSYVFADYMEIDILRYLLIGIGMYGFASLVADKLVVDGMDYREKGCVLNSKANFDFSSYPVAKKDPLGLYSKEEAVLIYNPITGKLDKEEKVKILNLATGKWEYEVKAPAIPKKVKDSSDFRAWFKTLTKAQQDAVKAKYLESSK